MVGAHRRVVIDLGAGDGRFVVKTAAADPDSLVVGVDANASGLYDGFRRAHKAGLTNALFVVASAEALPAELTGVAREVRIQFPWGTLLAAVLGADRHVLGAVAGLLQPGGRLTLLASVVERDGIEGIDRLDVRTAAPIAERIAAACDALVLERCRLATAADIAASHSTWGKRLGVGRSRPAWLFQYRKHAECR